MRLEYSVEKPLNREPPTRDLIKSFITEAETAYDRNHGPFPYLDADTFLLRIDGAVKSPIHLSMSTLRNDFTQHEVISALQCAGNRRHTMRTEVKEVSGLDWNDGAVCNCTWSGPLLSDVLQRCELELKADNDNDSWHVSFNCHQTDVQDDEYYGASIPLSRCMDRTKMMILALDMNGSPLTVNHGFPLRAVMPGIAGARWTKWLDHIRLQPGESSNFYMQRDYKILPPHVTTKEQALAYWPLVPAIQGLPINSIIAYPEPGSTVRVSTNQPVEVAGYALPQADDGPVLGVDVSIDRGVTWEAAEIVFPGDESAEKYKWAWAIWKYQLPARLARTITPETKIWSRARDAGGNIQDGTIPWNYRGVAYNAYGETKGLCILEEEQSVNGVKHG